VSDRRQRTRASALLLIAVLAALAWPAAAAIAAADDLRSQPKAELERLKLAAEVAKLRHDNAVAEGLSGALLRFAPFLTILVAAGGLGATIAKQASEQRSQRRDDLEERKKERDDRRLEAHRRLEDRFAAILSELGSAAPATQAGAAASLVTYLEPEHREFHHQARLAVLTNLKLDHIEPIRKLLAQVYGMSLESGAPVDRFERDLSRAKLAETSLCDIDLREADLAFADLTNATLLGSDLYRARGFGVILEGARLGAGPARAASLIEVRFKRARCQGADFSGARLINAHLQEADLRGARFFGATLQAAHLEKADLRGARFQDANLADTYFHGAILDVATVRTIARAVNWRKAHFDSEVKAALVALTGSG